MCTNLICKNLIKSCIVELVVCRYFQNFSKSCQSCHLQTKFYFPYFLSECLLFFLEALLFLILFFVALDSNTCGMNLTPTYLFMNWLKHTVFLTLQFVYIFLCKTLQLSGTNLLQWISWFQQTGLNHYVNIYMKQYTDSHESKISHSHHPQDKGIFISLLKQ